MGRHTNKQRRERTPLENYDTMYLAWPELPHIASVIVVPLKTRYINMAAAPDAKVDKLIHDEQEAEAYLRGWLLGL